MRDTLLFIPLEEYSEEEFDRESWRERYFIILFLRKFGGIFWEFCSKAGLSSQWADNPNRDCRVWDHTSSRLLLYRKMAGFQTVGRIPTVAYLASNGIHRASVRLANIKATLMLFRGNKAIWGKGNQTLDQWYRFLVIVVSFYVKRLLFKFWRRKDGEFVPCSLAICEMIHKMADRQKNMDQISNFFDSNLIWSLELILK